MSKMSKVMESALRHKNYKEGTSDKNKAAEYMDERSLVEDGNYKLPKRIYLTKVKNEEMFGCQMVIFNERETTKHIILYLHGGAYVNEIQRLHIAL